MSKLQLVGVSALVLVLSGCMGSAARFEEVRVSLGNISCAEDIQFDRTNSASLDLFRNGENNSAALSLDTGLGALVSTEAKGPEKRCDEILQSAINVAKSKELEAAANAEMAQIKLSSVKSDAEIHLLENKEEIEYLKDADQDPGNSW